MNTRSNPALTAVLDELNAVGARFDIERKRHVKIRWQLPDGRRNITVVSVTSGDYAPIKARAEVRRQLRQMIAEAPATA